jgi:hypothetical protein
VTTSRKNPIKKQNRWCIDRNRRCLKKKRLLVFPQNRSKRRVRRRMDPRKKHGEMDTKQRRTVRTKRCP